jgi:hypothetical protein
MEYAEAMTDTPPTVDDDLVNELRAHLDPIPLIGLAALVCVENVRSVPTRLSVKPRSGSRSVATTYPVTEPERSGGDAASHPDASVPSGMARLQPIKTRRQDGRDR